MTSTDFDLTPDPRVLQILGEINLDQWKCLAELIDNSVDAFINARRDGAQVDSPAVVISLPTQDKEDASVTVRDNGPGMTLEQLERAVRAGWSGNNPLDNLGLFGMGFNIATARLGMVTEVYTTRAGDPEWTGLRIDLNELRRTRIYQTPRLTRPKHDSSAHGTEIKILRLKADQRVYFPKAPITTRFAVNWLACMRPCCYRRTRVFPFKSTPRTSKRSVPATGIQTDRFGRRRQAGPRGGNVRFRAAIKTLLPYLHVVVLRNTGVSHGWAGVQNHRTQAPATWLGWIAALYARGGLWA